jgi:hypothetical protein
MDEAVGKIDRRAPEKTFLFGLAPLALRHYLVDAGHPALVGCGWPYRNSGTKQCPDAL